ncbi:MAG: hypothetical protein ACRDNM_09595 [Gaiellaceae bacterium]
MSVATERERMTWADLGDGARDLAAQIAAVGYEPSLILGIARGGLLAAVVRARPEERRSR